MSDERLTAGVIDDMPEADYHRHGALSATDAKRLNDCPARFRYYKDGATEYKAEFDIGHAAHKLVLGVGAEVEVIDVDDWRTKAAREARDAAREAGRIPVKRDEYDMVQRMAEAIRAHPIAGRLFTQPGKPEASMLWPDGDVWRRARLDYLPDVVPGKRLVIPDYKTSTTADPERFRKLAGDYGYHQQAAWYLDGAIALLGVDDPAFVFVVQERDPPYLVTVVELHPHDIRGGRLLNRRAIETYRACRAADYWPGYADDVVLIELPPWQRTKWEELEGTESW